MAKEGSIGWTAGKWETLLHDRRSADEGDNLLDAECGLGHQIEESLRENGMMDDSNAEEALCDQVWGDAYHLGRGIFSLVYGAPETQTGGPAWARAAASAVAAIPGLEDARRSVAGDPDMAAIATASILRGVTERAAELVERLLEQGDDPTGTGEEADDSEMVGTALGTALRGAIVDAIQEVASARSELEGLLPGLGGAPAYHEQERTDRLTLLARMRRDPRMMKILKIAGRIRRIAERVQRTRADDMREEVVDVERGADLGRILPSELVGLRHPVLRRLALKGLAERSLLQYRLSGTEPLGHGPIVILLDCSGSMDEPLTDGLSRQDWATTIGIAAVRSGLEQKRTVTVIPFSGVVERGWVVSDRKSAEDAIFGLLRLRSDGGTNFDAPIAAALDGGAEKARADLILVTDGAGIVSHPLIQRVEESKARGLRVWGILAGEGSVPAPLDTFANGIVTIGTNNGDAAEKIGKLGAT